LIAIFHGVYVRTPALTETETMPYHSEKINTLCAHSIYYICKLLGERILYLLLGLWFISCLLWCI